MLPATEIIDALRARGNLPMRVVDNHGLIGSVPAGTVMDWDDQEQAYVSRDVFGHRRYTWSTTVREQWGSRYRPAPASQMEMLYA